MLDTMSTLLAGLTEIGWLEASYVNEQSLKVRWSSDGLAQMLAISEGTAGAPFSMSEDELACFVTLLQRTLPYRRNEDLEIPPTGNSRPAGPPPRVA